MTATQTATRSGGSPSYRATARFKTRLRPDRPTTGPRLEEVARQLFGFDPLPWQREAFALIGELFTAEEAAELGVPFGTPAYREVLLTVPRQSGKSTVMLASAVERCLFWRGVEDDRLQSVIYTAQTGWDAPRCVFRASRVSWLSRSGGEGHAARRGSACSIPP